MQWFWRVSVLNLFPYINLHVCKMKRPLVGTFLGGFYFYVQTLLTMSKGCYFWKSLHLDYWFTRRRAL